MRIDPHGTGQQLKCFKCGFYGDIVDLYQQQHSCTAGEAFTALHNIFNITIDAEATRTPTEPRKVEQGINTTTAENQPETATERPDFSAYLNEKSVTLQGLCADTPLSQMLQTLNQIDQTLTCFSR